MAAQSKFAEWWDKVEKFFNKVGEFLDGFVDWCKGDEDDTNWFVKAIGKALTGIISWMMPNSKWSRGAECAAIGFAFFLIFILIGIGLFQIFPALSFVLDLFSKLVNVLKTLIVAPTRFFTELLELIYSLVNRGITSFQTIFLEVAGALFGVGGTVAGLTGASPYLMRVFVINILVYIALKMWNYFLVDHETWISSPTYRIFHVINYPLAAFKGYLKDFLPSILYPLVNTFLFPIEATEMFIATSLGFVVYVFDQIAVNSK